MISYIYWYILKTENIINLFNLYIYYTNLVEYDKVKMRRNVYIYIYYVSNQWHIAKFYIIQVQYGIFVQIQK